MIVIRLEMWPLGDKSRMYELGRTYIYNTGGDAKRGDYRVAVRRKGDHEIDGRQEPGSGALRTGEVKDYPRLSYNVWRLIIRALRSAFPEER